MTFQVKITMLFFVLFTQVSAQELVFIPDINLRNELSKEGFVTNDSLDIRKTEGRLQLELNDKGIENLEGLQYFEQVSRLEIDNNRIKRIDNLPPNLTDFFCSNNKISCIENLPANLKYLFCSNNIITIINNLPPNLISFDFSNNSMNTMPLLPMTLQHLNYSNNPIPLDSLPKLFRRASCDDQAQNCLPYELMNWRILNATVKDTSLKITGMTIKLNAEYSWGFGSQIETINFNIKDSKLVADRIEVNRKDGKNVANKDSNYFNKMKCSVEVSKINQLLKDIYSNEMLVQIQVGDSVKSINLKNKKNGSACSSSCSDCTYYYLQYVIYSEPDTIKLNYEFDSGYGGGVTICSSNGPENIKSILDWLYIYKLTNLTFDKHEITTYYFNKSNLDRIVKWAK
jgi:hypothetical protein